MTQRLRDLMTEKRVVGILVTLLSIGVNELVLRVFGWPVSVALILSVPVFVAYYSGLRAGLASVTLITLYRFFWLPPDNFVTGILGVVNMFISALVVGVLYRRAKAVDELLNGNSKKLDDAFNLIRELSHHWDWYTDKGRLQVLKQIEDRLGNLATVIFGFAALRKEINEVSTFYKGEKEK